MVRDITGRFSINVDMVSLIDRYERDDGVHYYVYLNDSSRSFEVTEEVAEVIRSYHSVKLLKLLGSAAKK